MPRRQPPSPLPRLWLFTDERVDDARLLRAVCRLPGGSGIVFRHYGLGDEARDALFAQIVKQARGRGLLLLDAGEAKRREADGVHRPAQEVRRRSLGRSRGRGALLSTSAHNRREIALANRAGANLIFLSPVFATRSHPGGRALGLWRFAALARLAHCPVIALGGMSAARYRRVKPLGAYGWAAIDALVSSWSIAPNSGHRFLVIGNK
ncbi:MAG: thiamine phosphate synthase [Sphingobium sp.]|nr:thiamine phosphate synthase [Sphingobium sp.]MBP6111942.1 thiamine phosphate synthase [Sphingobium sp.]MBP8671072.1 thiamine phosphate synthase [Sphingobium sp.]MBP9158721.1 thiamine phosphate synthase [Sphingobium sp.]MCC6482623.1 thiamine phosphate synthase [Sphingomonadaceae bacterium]